MQHLCSARREHRYNHGFMLSALPRCFRSTLLLTLVLATSSAFAVPGTSWTGILTDEAGKPVAGAIIRLHSPDRKEDYASSTESNGKFDFVAIAAGTYELSVRRGANQWISTAPVAISNEKPLTSSLQLIASGQVVQVQTAQVQELTTPTPSGQTSAQGTGGERLSSSEVSSLPLNARDFSKLLLLAAGTMTDANGAANFTQQFAVNGQRGVTTVFAIDGFDTTDPEMGGATFSNYNVDAIQEVESSSGVLPAEIGHGAASYTNVVTKSGVNQIHGSVFEFLRNASLDARNYFDSRDPENRRRIPPFQRNEFGFTNGGPVVLPKIYNGRDRTFYFGEYQGFRQVLGTTQVLPVPSVAERQGIDTTTFPGDTLTVPVNPAVAAVLNGYPLPNEPNGAFGDRTYAASSKVVTRTDQFSIRIDHKISNKASLLTRFSLNQVTGPLTNPDQTAINPTFGVQFFDHQRNAGVKYVRTISPHMISETSLSYIRSTPFFPTTNHEQPGITFADGLYQPYYQPAGSIFGSYSNLYQFKEDIAWTHSTHSFKWGTEIRVNRDSTIFGTNPNGLYEFGGGPAYSPVKITSASGTHDIQIGDPLPDSLTGLLTATPYSYNVIAAASLTPIGGKFNEAGVQREAYNFYFQDTWKATPQLTVNYGLRYEVNSRIHEATKRTSLPIFLGADGKPTGYGDRTATQTDADQSATSVRSGLERLGAAPFAGLCPRQAHSSSCGRDDHDAHPKFVAGQFPDRCDSFRLRAVDLRAAQRAHRISKHVCSAQPAYRVRHSGAANFRDRTHRRCPFEHSHGSRRDFKRPQRTRTGERAAAEHHRHREEFRQRLHRELDSGGRSRFRRLQIQYILCGDDWNSPGAGL